MRKLTTEEWVKKAKSVHGTQYNYDKTVYAGAREKLIIVCPIHGEFKQRPTDHIKGAGCMDCSGKRQGTIKTFLEKAFEVHKNKYDYSKVKLINNNTSIEIICPEHGPFWQTPDKHINRKQGCCKCNGGTKLTKEEFIEKAIQIHNFAYSYENTEYADSKTKVTIICPVHGEFLQTPNAHLVGQGCPECGLIKRIDKSALSLEAFAQRANEAHKYYYDYSKVKYINIDTKVIIICPEHGEFLQTPYVHLKGHKCPSCAKYGFDQTKPGTLYYLRITTEENKILYKIGITNRTVNARFSLTDLKKIEIIKQEEYEFGADALNKETEVKRKFKQYQYKGQDILESGNTELFTEDVLALYEKEVN